MIKCREKESFMGQQSALTQPSGIRLLAGGVINPLAIREVIIST